MYLQFKNRFAPQSVGRSGAGGGESINRLLCSPPRAFPFRVCARVRVSSLAFAVFIATRKHSRRHASPTRPFIFSHARACTPFRTLIRAVSSPCGGGRHYNAHCVGARLLHVEFGQTVCKRWLGWVQRNTHTQSAWRAGHFSFVV